MRFSKSNRITLTCSSRVPFSTFRRIRRTVVPWRSSDQEEAPPNSLHVPLSPVLRRNASGLFFERTVQRTTTTNQVISNRLRCCGNCLPVSTSTDTRHVAPSSATIPDTLPEVLMKQTSNATAGSVDSARSSVTRL